MSRFEIQSRPDGKFMLIENLTEANSNDITGLGLQKIRDVLKTENEAIAALASAVSANRDR